MSELAQVATAMFLAGAMLGGMCVHIVMRNQRRKRYQAW